MAHRRRGAVLHPHSTCVSRPDLAQIVSNAARFDSSETAMEGEAWIARATLADYLAKRRTFCPMIQPYPPSPRPLMRMAP